MNHSIRSAAIPIGLALLAVPGSAQPWQLPLAPVYPPEAQGMFSGFSVGMTVGGVGTPDPLVIRAPGVYGEIPTTWTAGTFTPASALHPDYSIDALTTWAPAPNSNPTLGPIVPEVSFGGISTGGEVMPFVQTNGELTMTTGNWFMLSVAVAPSATGVGSSVLDYQRAMANPPRNPAGDIFSYYAVGSQGINTALVDHAFLESSREQLKIDYLTTPAATHEILNLDYGMGVISTDPTGKTGNMFRVRDCFYFTLTLAYVNQMPSVLIGNQPINAWSVYGMHWNGSTWDAPQTVFSSSQLFQMENPGVEIDALSVFRGPSNTWNQPLRVILSLTLASNAATAAGGPFDQILVWQSGWNQGVQTLKTAPLYANGTSRTFSERLGLRTTSAEGGPDEVTATCGGDPPDLHVEDAVVALATDEPKTGPGTLGCSAIRTCPHDSNGSADDDSDVTDDTLHIQVTGLEHSTWQYVLVQLFDEGPVGTGTPQAFGPLYLVDATSLALNAYRIDLAVPCNLIPLKWRFSATLYGLNFAPGPVCMPLGESCVLTIKL